jgi:20S proteasome alpha/beta subunit
VAEFQKGWKKRLPESVYEPVWAEIKDFRLETDFMIGGIDDQGAHHLFCVIDPGRAGSFTPIGYAAIGIGHEHALKMLGFRGYNWAYLSRAQSVYAVLEAKTFAEGPYVGKETMLVVIDFKGGRVIKMFIPIHSEIRRLIKVGNRAEAEQLIEQDLDNPNNWQPLSTL